MYIVIVAKYKKFHYGKTTLLVFIIEPLIYSVLSVNNIPTKVIWGENDKFLIWETQKDQVVKGLKIDPKNIHVLKFSHFLQEEAYTEICDIILY